MSKSYLGRIATRDQVQAARTLLEEGSVANRGTFDGDDLQQLFGLQAQIIVCDLLGIDRPEHSEGWDGGVDIEYKGLSFDVKCVLRNVDVKMKWKCNVPESQLAEHYAADGYIFASYNKVSGEFQFVGWILKTDFLEKASKHPPGSRITRADGTVLKIEDMTLYDITISDLNRIRTLKDLKAVGA